MPGIAEGDDGEGCGHTLAVIAVRRRKKEGKKSESEAREKAKGLRLQRD